VVFLSKIILVTAEYDPLRGKIRRVLREISEEKGIEIEEREEDWDFLIKYGERDEIGGFNIPQVFVQYDDGSVKHVLTRIPLSEEGKLDLKRAKEIILRAL